MMPTFAERFRCTGPLRGRTAFASRLAGKDAPRHTAGVYDHGLITLFSKPLDKGVLALWEDFDQRFEGFASTALGFVFLHERDTGAAFLMDVDARKVGRVADSVALLLDTVLTRDDIIDDALSRPFVEQLVALHGPLPYGTMYVADPSLDPEESAPLTSYHIGDLAQYLIDAAVSERGE
jgi:hypothetical protein